MAMTRPLVAGRVDATGIPRDQKDLAAYRSSNNNGDLPESVKHQ